MKGIIGSKTRYQRLFYGIKGYNKGAMKILKAIYISSKVEEKVKRGKF